MGCDIIPTWGARDPSGASHLGCIGQWRSPFSWNLAGCF